MKIESKILVCGAIKVTKHILRGYFFVQRHTFPWIRQLSCRFIMLVTTLSDCIEP